MTKLSTYIGSGILSATLGTVLIAVPVYAKNAPTLKIENFIGTINVVTGDYEGISVTDADGALVEVTTNGILIDGGQKTRHVNCKTKKTSVKIGIGKNGLIKHGGTYKDLKEYPKVKIKAPKNMHLVIEKSVIFGNVETIGSGDLHVRSCGDITIGDVTGPLDLAISGSGDVKIGDAGASDISISGSGDLETGDLASVELKMSGASDIDIGDVLGHMEIRSSGAGDVTVGRIKGGLHYVGSGASDFDAEYVDGGDLYIDVSGSSDTSIDDGDVNKLYIEASGASDVDYHGSSVNGETHASGASDITLKRPSGSLDASDSGAGDVNVR
ncbi:MAG: DUF2807 domain-containing protein [Robiginitomaculum sp.]